MAAILGILAGSILSAIFPPKDLVAVSTGASLGTRFRVCRPVRREWILVESPEEYTVLVFNADGINKVFSKH